MAFDTEAIKRNTDLLLALIDRDTALEEEASTNGSERLVRQIGGIANPF
jgi:hypothetical protein